MAKKNQKIEPLSFVDIVLGGDAETIRQALEARIQIDQLLEEREEAYRKIAALETQVESIVGEEGVFPFPEPPVEVASFAQPTKKKPARKAITTVVKEPAKEKIEESNAEEEKDSEDSAPASE